MTPATHPPFPGPRDLADWRVRFPEPAALLFGRFLVTWVEAAVRGPCPTNPLVAAVVRALTIAGPADPHELDRVLHLGPDCTAAVLGEARRLGLVDGDGVIFRVVASPQPPASRVRFALRFGHLVPLPDPGPFALPMAGVVGNRGVGWLRTLFALPPAERNAVGLPAGELAEDGWETVPLEREQAFDWIVVVSGEAVAVYPLPAAVPVVELAGERARAAFPEAFAEPAAADAAAAWLAWATARGVPAADAAGCRVTLDGGRLEVLAPGRLVGWLRASRAEALAAECWVWVGRGPVRRAARLDVREG